MQDRYAGDVGDFGKLALLRVLAPDRHLGVCWYLTDGKGETNRDGRHLGYLDRADQFRDLDAALFDTLKRYREEVGAGRRRCVESLEQLNLLPRTTIFHRVLCPPRSARTAWARAMVEAMQNADLVLLDPDNGLEGARQTPKCASLTELVSLRRDGRAVLLYQHQARRRRGARAEFAYVAERLQTAGFQGVEALRLRPYSPRFYFLLDGDAALSLRLAEFAAHWRDKAELWRTSR